MPFPAPTVDAKGGGGVKDGKGLKGFIVGGVKNLLTGRPTYWKSTRAGFPKSSWSFLAEPLRPALFLLLPLLMKVFTKAATAKHATIILRGAEKVMVERRDAETIEWKL